MNPRKAAGQVTNTSRPSSGRSTGRGRGGEGRGRGGRGGRGPSGRHGVGEEMGKQPTSFSAIPPPPGLYPAPIPVRTPPAPGPKAPFAGHHNAATPIAPPTTPSRPGLGYTNNGYSKDVTNNSAAPLMNFSSPQVNKGRVSILLLCVRTPLSYMYDSYFKLQIARKGVYATAGNPLDDD
jgi:hypothetical protein